MKNEALIPLFASLVSKFGKDNELYTFDTCSNFGIELADSTIDKIELIFGFDDITNVMFYFNENTGDCCSIDRFNEDELLDFYKELKNEMIKSVGEEKVFGVINTTLQSIFSIEDSEQIAESIIDEVIWHIHNIFDNEYTDDNIESAIKAILKDKLM